MEIYEDVVCAFCGSLCDDLVVEVENNQILAVKKACSVGRAKLLNAQQHPAPSRVNGRQVPLEKTLDEAARILSEARHALVYGLSSTTTEAQRETVGLADLIGATIDNPSSY